MIHFSANIVLLSLVIAALAILGGQRDALHRAIYWRKGLITRRTNVLQEFCQKPQNCRITINSSGQKISACLIKKRPFGAKRWWTIDCQPTYGFLKQIKLVVKS